MKANHTRKGRGVKPLAETPSCGKCGEEMVLNVPRLGPTAGWVHRYSGGFTCPITESEARQMEAEHQERNGLVEEAIHEERLERERAVLEQLGSGSSSVMEEGPHYGKI